MCFVKPAMSANQNVSISRCSCKLFLQLENGTNEKWTMAVASSSPTNGFRSNNHKRVLILGLLLLISVVERLYSQVQYSSSFAWSDGVIGSPSVRLQQQHATSQTNVTGKETSIGSKESHHHTAPSFPPGDGTFNNIPIYYREETTTTTPPRYSSVRCIGENFQGDNWSKSHMTRSCLFHHLCFNTTTHQFVLFRSPHEDKLLEYTTQNIENDRDEQAEGAHAPRKQTFVSTTMYNKTVALAPLVNNDPRLHQVFQWFPDIVTVQGDENGVSSAAPPRSFYELPDGVAWIPFQAVAGHNPGHLLWDSFLTIFKLLTIFGIQDKYLLIMRMHMGKPVWGTCEMTSKLKEKCRKMIPKFLPFMATSPDFYSNSNDFQFLTTTTPKSDLVCAKTAAAGLGLLSDHGWGQHGQTALDFEDARMVGQSAILRQFRDYGMKNLGVPTPPPNVLEPPYRIVFSRNSTGSRKRNVDLTPDITACRAALSHRRDVQIQEVEFATMPLAEQIQFISETAILISVTGGGTATATFLPDGSSLILLYMMRYKQPQYHDFGIFENAGYIQPHWIPITWPEERRAKALADVILFELERMKTENNLYQHNKG